MPSLINPYLNFQGTARAAIEFYQAIFGGQLDMNTYGEFKMTGPGMNPDQIMHAQLTTPDGMTLMASDVPPSMSYQPGETITLSLSGSDEQQLRGYWEQLAQDGQVDVPLAASPWGDTFGILHDKFGIRWMVNIATQATKAA